MEFTLSPAPLTITLLPAINGSIQFQFNAESNRTYAVEYWDGFPTTNWLVLTNVAALPIPATILVSDNLTNEESRFFRIRTP